MSFAWLVTKLAQFYQPQHPTFFTRRFLKSNVRTDSKSAPKSTVDSFGSKAQYSITISMISETLTSYPQPGVDDGYFQPHEGASRPAAGCRDVEEVETKSTLKLENTICGMR